MTSLIQKIFGKKPTVSHVLTFNEEQEYIDLQENHSEFFVDKNNPEVQMQSRVNDSANIADVTLSRSASQNVMQPPTISSSGEILEGYELSEFEEIDTDNEEIEEDFYLQKDNIGSFEIFDNMENENKSILDDDPDLLLSAEELMQSNIHTDRPTRRDMLHSEGIL